MHAICLLINSDTAFSAKGQALLFFFCSWLRGVLTSHSFVDPVPPGLERYPAKDFWRGIEGGEDSSAAIQLSPVV